mmetsp:Transcript_13399/g.24638  ORF Transcript_13399/g.24638 Transcript_13399/m.24638 type:complete len:964 (-) Transcript_13399:41-2932(-)
MFLLPYSIGLTCEIFTTLLHTLDPTSFPQTDLTSSSFKDQTSGLWLLSIVRLLFLLPLILNHSKNRRLTYPTLYTFLLLVSYLLIVSKAISLVWNYKNLTSETFVTRQWLIIYLSLAGTSCLGVCLMHLRSSVKKTLKPNSKILAYNDSSISLDLPPPSPSSNLETPLMSLPGAPTDNNRKPKQWLKDLEAKVDLAKSIWDQKLDHFKQHLNLPKSAPTPFSSLLNLYTHSPNAIQSLQSSYTHSPTQIRTLIPQLLTFLIYNAWLNNSTVESFLLQTCEHDLHFAHKVYWFLKGWCGEEEGQFDVIRRLVEKVNLRGEGPACLLEVGRGPGESGRGIGAGISSITSPPHQFHHTSLSPTNQNSYQNPPLPPTTAPLSSPSLLPQLNGEISQRHLQSIQAVHRLGFFGLSGLGKSSESCFLATPHFLTSLVEIADSLFPLQKEQRTQALRKKLEVMEFEMLPSNVIYLPLGDSHHRIWRAVPDESIAISTKERVPCIITFEIVSYGPSVTNSSSTALERWWQEKRYPQRHNNFFEKVDQRFQMISNRVSSMTKQWQGHEGAEEDEDSGLLDVVDGNVTPPPTLYEDDETTRSNSSSRPEQLGQWQSPVRESESSAHTMSAWGRDRKALSNPQPAKPRTYSDGTPPPNNPIPSNSSSTSLNLLGSAQSTRPVVVFKEGWAEKEDRLRPTSSYGHLPGWSLRPVFVKSNDDLRQEQLASQLIKEMATILADAKVPTWLYPYEILAIDHRSGVIEAVKDSISLDSLKRNCPDYTSLADFFKNFYGDKNSDEYCGAKANFVESLAAYSVVCYILQIKDRHNGNILLTKHGHIVHIDFGFFFLSSPGKGMGFETAPFKLTREFVELMDGPNSRTFMRFRDLVCKTFMCLRRDSHRIILLVEMIVGGNEDLPCFNSTPDRALAELRDRFKLDMNDSACRDYVDSLVDESLENWRTRWYDRYQRCCTGVL